MIRIEKFEQGDIPGFLLWMFNTDREFLVQFAGPHYDFPLDKKQLLETVTDENILAFKAVEEKNNLMIGHCQLIRINRETKSASLGKVLINPRVRGQGYGSNMVKQVMDYAKQKLNLKKLSLRVFEFNTAAYHCYLSLGFSELKREEVFYKTLNKTWTCITMTSALC